MTRGVFLYSEYMNAHTNEQHPREPRSTSFGNPGSHFSTRFYGYEDEPYHLPLRIYYAGRIRYLREHFWQRTNSSVFLIELVTHGDTLFVQDGKDYVVKEGEVLVARKGCSNLIRPGPSGISHRRFLEIDGPLLETLLQSTGLAESDYLTPKSRNRIYHLLKKAYRVLEEKQTDFTHRLSILAYELLLELSFSVSKQAKAGVLGTALDFMMNNLTRPLKVKTIADHACVSVPTLYRLFHDQLACAPIDFFLTQKIRFAADLLTHTTSSEIGRAHV